MFCRVISSDTESSTSLDIEVSPATFKETKHLTDFFTTFVYHFNGENDEKLAEKILKPLSRYHQNIIIIVYT